MPRHIYKDKEIEMITYVDKPIYIDHVIEQDIELIDNSRNENL